MGPCFIQTINNGYDFHIRHTQSNKIIFSTSNIERGTIESNGGLVWGSPTGASKGAGTINAVGVYDDNVLLTDYVFEKYYDGQVEDEKHADYEMKTLQEEIQHTKDKKHLSTMIGREEWEESGKASTGQLINQLWETVETQFLYIKQLEERIAKLEQK